MAIDREIHVAKANILKLLKFDEDIREAVTTGRRLRNCTFVQPRSAEKINTTSVCFVGVAHTGVNVGPVVAAATSMRFLNWNQSIKTELDRMNKGAQANPDAGRNRLTETLLQQTSWGVAEVSEDHAFKVGAPRAVQIAMLKAIGSVLTKMAPYSGSIIVLVDESQTIPELRYGQMAIANGTTRSACLAAADVVAHAYRARVLEKLEQYAPPKQPYLRGEPQDFAPPIEVPPGNFLLTYPLAHNISR